MKARTTKLITAAAMMALALSGTAHASAARAQQADSLVSTDGTKSFALPSSTQTLVGRTSTDTLTNKSFGDAVTHAQVSTPSAPSSGSNKLYFKTDGNLYMQDASGIETQTNASVGTGTVPAVFMDQETSGTAGGTATSGFPGNVRVLNTQQNASLTPWATLASNQITLQPGTYTVLARCPAYAVVQHQCRFYNVTDSTDAIIGSSSYSSTSGTGSQLDSIIQGTVVITAQKTFQLYHQVAQTNTTSGLGAPLSGTTPEIYASVVIWRAPYTAAPNVPAHFYDSEPANSDGGSSISGIQTRILNTQVASSLTPWATLASNQVTLTPGTYYFDGRAPGFFVGGHQTYIYNVTDSAIALTGSSAYSQNGSQAYVTDSFVRGSVVISATKVFELRHYTAGAISGAGLGPSVPGAASNEYASLTILKIQ